MPLPKIKTGTDPTTGNHSVLEKLVAVESLKKNITYAKADNCAVKLVTKIVKIEQAIMFVPGSMITNVWEISVRSTKNTLLVIKVLLWDKNIDVTLCQRAKKPSDHCRSVLDKHVLHGRKKGTRHNGLCLEKNKHTDPIMILAK